MDHAERLPGWQISQVVELIDMPRRDITRSCYADRKRGGAGILQPRDGSWGRRNYSVEDIAWLYLVKLQHEAGYSLPEIAQRMDTSVGVDELCAHLDAVANRAAEGLDELRLKVERARALRCALGAGSAGAHEAIERYLQERLGVPAVEELRRMLERLATVESSAAATHCMDERNAASRDKSASGAKPGNKAPFNQGTTARSRIRRILDDPGMDLAIELWAGPGAFDQLVKEYVD